MPLHRACARGRFAPYETWRAAGPESEASSDLSSACADAAKVLFGREGRDPSAGSLRPRMQPHHLVGGLLGLPLAEPILEPFSSSCFSVLMSVLLAAVFSGVRYTTASCPFLRSS